MNITKQLIRDFGFTEADIASKLGCSVSSVRNWYKGKQPLRSYAKRLNALINYQQLRKYEVQK